MKKILYLSHRGKLKGGGERSFFDLICSLDKNKVKPYFVSSYKGSLSEKLRSEEIEVHILPMPSLRKGGIFSFFKSVGRIRDFIRKNEINLVHANGFRSMLYGGWAAKKEKVPVIWHVRIADKDRLFDSMLFRLADKVICISDSVCARFSSFKDASRKIVKIHNGVNLNEAEPFSQENAREKLGLPKEKIIFGNVGRLVRFKGLKYYIEAAALLLKKHSGAVFLIVGEGELKKSLMKQAVKLGISESVRFLGEREDIPIIMKSLDVFVLSSVLEPFGRVLVEAMAASKPVIATRAGGVPEIVVEGETGLLISPKNPAELAKAMETLLNNPDKREVMGKKGRLRAEQLFSRERMTENIESLYESLI